MRNIKNIAGIIGAILLIASTPLNALYFLTLDPISNRTNDTFDLTILSQHLISQPGKNHSLTGMLDDSEPLSVIIEKNGGEYFTMTKLFMDKFLDNKEFRTDLGDYTLVFKQIHVPEKPSKEIDASSGIILRVTPPKLVHLELEIQPKPSLYEKIMKAFR